MDAAARKQKLSKLRAEIYQLQGYGSKAHASIPIGVPEIDNRLTGKGLAVGTIHEVCGGSIGALHGAAAAHFCAMMAAKTRGKIFWCMTRFDIYAPALAQAGLDLDRVVFCKAGSQVELLATAEEALRHRGVGAVVAEVSRLGLTESRRLKLAAEASGALGLCLRRFERAGDVAGFGMPNACATRWRVTAVPGETLPVEGVGAPRLLVEIVKSTAGASADFLVDVDASSGTFTVPGDLAHRSLSAHPGHLRAVG